MAERRERTAGRGAVVMAALLVLAIIMAALCFSDAHLSGLRFSSGFSSAGGGANGLLGSPPRRRLQDDAAADGGDGDGDGDAGLDDAAGEGANWDAEGEEEIAMEDEEESASGSFDPDEDAGVAEELEEVQERSVGPVDVEGEFEAVNEKAEDEDALFALQEMKVRLKPRGPLDCRHVGGDPASNATKQFAHLHHMKTGGTSINRVVNCAVERARNGDREALPFASLSECGWGRFQQCTKGTGPQAEQCRERIDTAAVMQYCAPMFQMDRFGWLAEGTDVITTLRHPVGRVWSMFRFQTKGCYHCTPLVDIYRMIDDGTVDDWCDERRGSSGRKPPPGVDGEEKRGCDGVCMPQLLNHQTRNLMTTEWESPEGMAMSDQERLDEALSNLRTNIAVVGVTEELPTYRDILGQVFPWLAENVVVDPDADADKVAGKAQKTCALPHANASPRNNRCGEDGKSHWDLPDEPDDETREAILRHNQLDMKLYEAAVEKFALQKRALGLE